MRARVLDFFPTLRDGIEHLDSRKESLQVEHLLTMRTGTDFHEWGSDSPLQRMNRLRRGWLQFVLDSRMLREPGSRFQYDSGGVILLSGILAEATGQFADEYAAEHLCGPLGIEEARWFENESGLPHTGGGLDLRPRDMARFGLLYLRRGRWRDLGYGYLWWVWSPPGDRPEIGDFYAAHGFMGQYIFVVPGLDLVVVFTGGGRQWDGEKRPLELLYESILPAVASHRGDVSSCAAQGTAAVQPDVSPLSNPS